ncbi:MAG: serine/threonine-protein kinase [Acidobacteriota bacterium]
MQQPGTLIEGKYEILGKIREGGMGAIYKVRHRLLDEVRAIKVMRPQVLSDDELRQRFAEEAKTATRLKHPNICTIHDFALDDDGTAYLVMEFIDGVTLAEMEHKPAPLGMTLEVMHQALLALAYLHRRNVVHRDIAPDNLMLTSDQDGMPLVKLIDLGISKTLDQQGEDRTSTGVFLGKLKYASPEQFGALAPGEKIDGRSDLYCLGIVLYELLTGMRPVVGETPAQLLRAHLFLPPLPFSESDPEARVPPELRAIILKALEKKRDDRYASAEEFDRDIVQLKQAMDSAAESETTVAFFAKARGSRDGETGITPSAQNRLDRRFVAHPTPSPSNPSRITDSVAEQPTAMTPTPESRATEPFPVPVPARAPAGRRRALLGIAAAAVVLAGAVVVLRGRSPRAPTAVATRAAPVAMPAAPSEAVPTLPEPTIAPRPTQAPVEEAARPAAAIVPAPAVPAAARPTSAPRVRPTRFAPTPERIARKIDAPAREAPVFPTPASSAPSPVSIPAPPAPRPPTAVPPEAGVRETKTASPSDVDRIREVISRYERAQNTLDADLYSRVYPRVNRARVQSAFDEFRSQTVSIDQIRVEVAPGATRATVRLHERRVAVPRVGSEQRIDANRTIALQKEHDNWVITGLE